MWKMQYRVLVSAADAPEGVADAIGLTLLGINDTYDGELSLNQAINKAAQAVRMYQSVGVDAEAQVMGKPVGADAAGTARGLTNAEKTEKRYALIDTPARGLLQAINIASKAAPGVGNLDADKAPDVGAFVAAGG